MIGIRHTILCKLLGKDLSDKMTREQDLEGMNEWPRSYLGEAYSRQNSKYKGPEA